MLRRVLAAAALVAALAAPGVAPGATPRFTLTLTKPMRAGNTRLEPGSYDVTFEPVPAGGTHFTAVFYRGGQRVAAAPAELKGAPAGFKLSEIVDGWIQGTWNQNYARKDGSIHPARFEFRARAERAFFEALLTEIGMPEADGASKAPQTLTLAPHVAPGKALLPTRTPTPAKR